MNIILVEESECSGNMIELSDHRATHIIKILNADTGDKLKVGVVDGMSGLGKVLEIERKRPHRVLLELDFFEDKSPRPSIDLILALPRPIMLRRILSQVTAQGVGHIYLINANRVEKSFWDASILDPMDYREHLLLGLEQCVDTRLPTVSLHRRFKPFIEDFIPTVIDKYDYRIVADPSGITTLRTEIESNNGRLVYAIGPEGGWVDYELEKFQERQFSICNVGKRILKVDTAAVALHGHISALLN